MQMISSAWPNVVVAQGAKEGESVAMEDLLKKWEKLDLGTDEHRDSGVLGTNGRF